MVPLGVLLRKKECPFEKRVPFLAIVPQGHSFGTLFSLSVYLIGMYFVTSSPLQILPLFAWSDISLVIYFNEIHVQVMIYKQNT